LPGKKWDVFNIRRLDQGRRGGHGAASALALVGACAHCFKIYSVRRPKKAGGARQFKKVMGLVENKEHAEALAYIKKSKGALARILESCLSRPNSSRGAIEKSIRENSDGRNSAAQRYLNTLAVIAGAAPLLGLFGNDQWDDSLFAAVTHYGTGDPKFLAGGISEALITAKPVWPWPFPFCSFMII